MLPTCKPRASIATANHHLTTFYLNSILKAHIDSGDFETALSLFSSMREPDHFTLPLAIRAVSGLGGCTHLGEAVHCLGFQMGYAGDVYFCNALINMYVKNDCLHSAHQLFDEMPDRDVVSWTSLISGYVQSGSVGESFRLLSEMRWAGVEPSWVTVAVILRACGVEKSGHGGRQLHCFAIKRGYERHELVLNSILTAFDKVGSLEDVEKFFISIQARSIVSWNVLMSGYSSRGILSKVIDCFEILRSELYPSTETFTLAISASTKLANLLHGQKLHCLALKSGQINMVIEASLMDFYAKCGDLASSVSLFEEVRVKNNVLWSVMIWGFIQNGQFMDAVTLYRRMLDSSFEQTADTLRGLLLAYTELGALQLGKAVHCYLMKNYFCTVSDTKSLETSILNMYAKCGSIDLAWRCFDEMIHKDIIAWSSMIEGYAINGLGFKALELFYHMQEEGVEPNSITFLSLLSACSHSGLVSEGREVFDSMSKRFGIEPELKHYTCMVDLLGRCGKLYEALQVINDMNCEPDARIWGALLSSCWTHANYILGNYAAQKLLSLESDNVGYQVILSNIHVGDSKWDEAEKIREDMSKQVHRKKPGWSCIEEKGGFCMFVSGDTSHPQTDELRRILVYLTWQIENLVAGIS